MSFTEHYFEADSLSPMGCPVCGSVGAEEDMVVHMVFEHPERVASVTVRVFDDPNPGRVDRVIHR